MAFRIWKLITGTFQIWNRANASRMAAAMTYFTVLSLAPVLTLVIAIASFFFDPQQAEQEIVAKISEFTTPEIAQTVTNLLQNLDRPNSGIVVGVVSLGVLIFGASGVFSQLYDTFYEIWRLPKEARMNWRFMLKKRLMGILMVILVGLLLLTTLVESAAVTVISEWLSESAPDVIPMVHFLDRAVSYLVLPVIFALLFRYVPAVTIRLSDVWLAGMLTAILFAGSRYLVQLYVRVSATSELYGAAGSLVVGLIWIYVTCLILFLGASFSHAWTMTFGSRRDQFEQYLENPDEVLRKLRRRPILKAASNAGVGNAQGNS